MSASLMKTKMIPGLSMLVFNDINKPHRKFHLHYVICSVPQVAREPSDIESEETDGEQEEREKLERMQEFPCENSFPQIKGYCRS